VNRAAGRANRLGDVPGRADRGYVVRASIIP
jgi:hypothetical protein